MSAKSRTRLGCSEERWVRLARQFRHEGLIDREGTALHGPINTGANDEQLYFKAGIQNPAPDNPAGRLRGNQRQSPIAYFAFCCVFLLFNVWFFDSIAPRQELLRTAIRSTCILHPPCEKPHFIPSTSAIEYRPGLRPAIHVAARRAPRTNVSRLCAVACMTLTPRVFTDSARSAMI